MNLNIVILIAGVGKRMNSDLPKALHCIGGKYLLHHILIRIKPLLASKVVIVYSKKHYLQIKNLVDTDFVDNSFIWVEQKHQLGTADAVRCGLQTVNYNSNVLILSGDVPLIDCGELNIALQSYQEQSLLLFTAILKTENNYGKIVRSSKGNITKIIEKCDLVRGQNDLYEVNVGTYYSSYNILKDLLDKVTVNSKTKEYHFTDIVSIAYKDNITVNGCIVDIENFHGVNTMLDLECLERIYQQKLVSSYMQDGLQILNKSLVNVYGTLSFGKGCVIGVNCSFYGKVCIGDNVIIQSGCIIKDTSIDSNSIIRDYTVIEDSQIAKDVTVGPFAHIRPNSSISNNAYIGNFVEVKNSDIGVATKIAHMTYIGDSKIGKYVKIGAGVVTCNYDGVNKYNTNICDYAFIGSGAMLIAPITVSVKSFVAAGSVISKNTVSAELTIARSRQVTLLGWLLKNHKHFLEDE